MPAKATETATTPTGTMIDKGSEMANNAATLQAYGFKAMAGYNATWAAVLGKMGNEVLSFVADRIKEDVKTQHAMMHCRDAAEMQRIQADFVRTAIDQYTAETGKLVQMSQELWHQADADTKKT
ncbi:MAG: phasin family protein [Pseudomonadota bacterium]